MMKTFEEQFPSLKGKDFDARYYHFEDIEKEELACRDANNCKHGDYLCCVTNIDKELRL